MFHALILMRHVVVDNLETALLKYSLTDVYMRKQLFAVCNVRKLSLLPMFQAAVSARKPFVSTYQIR